MSHAAAMDRIYRNQRHFYDFTRKYFLLGRDRLIARLDPPPGGYVLEVGCGTARNLIRAARHYPHALFFGIDASEQILRTARRNIETAKLADRVRVAHGFAEDFEPDGLFGYGDRFDRIFFSYSLSMIPDWQGAVSHAFGRVRPGGRVLVVDFGDQRGLPRLFRKALAAWLGAFMVEPRADLPAFFRTVASRHDAVVGETRMHRGYSWLLEGRRAGQTG